MLSFVLAGFVGGSDPFRPPPFHSRARLCVCDFVVRLPKSFLRFSFSGFGKRARSEVEVGRGTGKAEEWQGPRSTGAGGSIGEVVVGNGRRTASVVGSVDEASAVESVVAVVELDVRVGDSERTEV